MSILRVIILDVGWGDSIIVESEDQNGQLHVAVIDSNDSSKNRFTLNFLKRRLQTLGLDYSNQQHFLDFVLLTHGHADHGQGLKAIMQEFGTKQFWYSKSTHWGSMGSLLRFARRSSNVNHHQAIDDKRQLPNFGDVKLNVLWPIEGELPENDENNNSVVMTLTLGKQTFLLSGDAEEIVWNKISNKIPLETAFIKVPHHGSVNGSLDNHNNPTWLNGCPQDALLGISCHVGRYGHPHNDVINLFKKKNRDYYRTDKHYHLIFETDGLTTTVQYHH